MDTTPSDAGRPGDPSGEPRPAPSIEPARWQAVAFVCGRCERRKGAPSSLDAKRAAKRLREGFREARLRSRIVGTGCMGLCPRGAIAVAVSVGGGPLAVIELKKKREVQAVVERLAPSPAAGSESR